MEDGNVRQIRKDMHNQDIHDPQTVLQRTATQFDKQAALTEDELKTLHLLLECSGIPCARNRLHAHWARSLIKSLQDVVM